MFMPNEMEGKNQIVRYLWFIAECVVLLSTLSFHARFIVTLHCNAWLFQYHRNAFAAVTNLESSKSTSPDTKSGSVIITVIVLDSDIEPS